MEKYCKFYLSFLAILLLNFAFPSQGWAGTTYYSKLTVSANPSAKGKVYVAKSSESKPSSPNTEATNNTTVSGNSASHSYKAWADANTGWSFNGWSGDGTSTDNPYTFTISATGTSETKATVKSLIATFVPVFQFKAKADFVTGCDDMGDVAVSFLTGSPDYKATAVTATDSQNGAEPTTANATKTANFNAQPHMGAEFRGWYSDATGTNKVSDKQGYSQSITSDDNDANLSPQLTLYAKFEKVETTPTWALEGVLGTAKTLEIGESIVLTTNTAGNTYSFGTPSYEDAGETNPVMNYDPATKTFTANRAGTVTVRFTQAAGEVGGVLWKAGEETFTFTVEKRTPEFAWADPLPNFVVGTTLPASEIFSFTPAESEANWTLTSDNESLLPSINSDGDDLSLPKEVTGVTLTFHQPATWEWKEIANTSIKINVTKEPVVFNWKNPSLIAGNNYSWTDFVETNSEGAWNLVSDDESVIPTMRSIANTSVQVAAGSVTLSFTQGQDLGHDAVSIQTKTFTVYPNNGIATYSANGKTFTDLNDAIAEANTMSKNKYVIVAADGVVVQGDYTIPAGVTLLVPHSGTSTSERTISSNAAYNIVANRTLTLVDGVNIKVNGTIVVGGELQSGDASHNPSGFPCGNVGILDMSKGGHIDVESGGKMLAWGFVRGQGYLDGNNTKNVGTITAKNGSLIRECFGVVDWGGGTATVALKNDASKVRIFPFQGYYVQNIEVPLTFEYGAKEQLYTNVYGNGSQNAADEIYFIGSQSGVLFRTNIGGVVTKWYDPTTDHMVVELEGNASLDNMKIVVMGYTINASDYDLPILYNMHIKLKNCQLSLSSPVVLQPGAIFEITKGSSLTLNTNMFVYDVDQWGTFVRKTYFIPMPVIPTPHLTRGDGKSKDKMDDAQLVVDGTLSIGSNGALYTTSGGGNVMGNNGGSLVWNRALPAKKSIYGYTNGNSVTASGIANLSSYLTADYIVENSSDPVRLHNDNNSYTASLGNGTFKNIHGRWFISTDAVELSDYTYKFTYIDGVNTAATAFCVYASDKTGLTAGYKWVNVALDNNFCGNKTFRGEDGNYYYYDNASKDAVSKWIQLVKLSDALYSGSDNKLYTFTDGCAWASVGEIGDDCMYTIDEVKMALVGTEFVALEKDEYDEVYVKTTDHSDYYMLFDGCVWQHATKIPDTYKAYEVLGNPYIWLDDEWTEVAAEGAYFYTTDDQGIKHYYEFDKVTFMWIPVRNKVRVTTPTGDKRDFLTFDDAIAYLSQYNDPTVTLLEDAVATKAQTFAPGPKSTTATIDLNGHMVTAELGAAEYLLNMNTSATLEITDNSDKENGEIRVYTSVAKRADVIRITKGKVKMTKGKLFIHNTSNSTSGNAAAIYAAAGQSVTMNGGELNAISTRVASGINAASSAALASSSIITMNGGVINATATYNAYGILSYGIINMNDGIINATTTTVNGVAASSYAYGIYAHASANATEANAYRSVLTMKGGTINSNSGNQYAYGVYAHAAATTCTSAKDGTYSNKAAAHMDISGGTINATAVGAYAYAVNPYGCFNSNTDNYSEANQVPHTIKNVTINAKGNSNAYGILVSATVADYSAGKLYGNVIVDNVNIHAETTGSTTAYGVYVSAAGKWLNRASYHNISAANRKTWYVPAGNASDGDLTHEAINGTESNTYKYQIGNYTCGAKCVVNGGTFYAKSISTTAAGIYAHSAASPGDNSRGYAELTINGGTFTGETGTDTGMGIYNFGNTTINAGTFNAITGTTTAYGAYCVTGTLELKGGTYNATSNGSTAYGVSAGATISTDNTTRNHGTVNVREGVVVNARSLTSSTVFGAYAQASAQELTEAKYAARSTSNKGQYCLVDAEGNLLKEALNATTNDGAKANFYKYQIGQYFEGGIVNIYGGTFNATANTSTAAGVAAHMSNITRTTEIGRHGTARGTVNVYHGTFNVECETSSTAMGVRSYGIVNVEDGTFNMTPKTTNAEGVRVYDGKTTINGGTFNINATTNTSYGVYTTPDWDANYAFGYSGEIIVNGGTFNIKTYGGDTSYGAYSSGGTKNMKGAKVTGDVAKDYAVAGSITINGGNFTMTPSTGKNAYGMVVAAPSVLNSAKAYSRGTINGGFFKMVATTNACATGANATEDEEGVPQLQVKGGHFSSKSNLEKTAPNNYVRDPYKVIDCIHPDYKTDYPFEVAEVCTITFKDDEDNTLWSGKQPKGTVAIYPLTNGVPEKAATADNSFEFISWDTPLTEITEDATYIASFNAVAKKYMVTWQDETGKEIDHMEWASGQTPTHDDPIKTGYTFTGWTPEISAVAGANQTYKATFRINTYTIRFVDEDGALLEEQVVNHGVKPTAPATPTKEGYSFSKWNPGVLAATEDITYTASYLLDIASVTTTAGKTTKYSTFAAALKGANAAENSTLVLLQDQVGLGVQTVTQSFTLDLNGHTLASATTKFITLNTAGKTLTIVDSQGGGRIELVANLDGEAYAVFINNGTVVLNNGTIHGENVHATAADTRKGIGVRIETASGKFVMNGGRVEGQSKQIGTGIYAVGPVEVYGGKITGTARSKARAIYSKAATLIVKDAHLEATTTTGTGAYGIYSDTNDKAPALTIDNVTINATSATTDAYGLNLYSGNKGTVSNVKIQATTAPVDADATAANVSITSGFFDKETNLAKYIGTKKLVALTTEPEKAEGYNYKIVDAAYQITFKAEDGTVLQQTNVEAGVQPVFMGEEPTKPSNPKTSYEFAGWSDGVHTYAAAEIPMANADVTYTATFIEHGVEYPITFYNIDGKGGTYVQMVAFDEMPVYDGPTPYMSGAVSNYAYTFIGWDPELAVVTGPTSYSPRYDLVISHNVSFVINNASATTPTTLTVAEGAAVECPADQLVDCQHIIGWYKDAGLNEEWDFANDKMGTSDFLLYAKWGTKTYTITWLDELGDVIDQTVVNCGTTPTHANLYKPSTATYSYEWLGWNKTIVAATADATYKSLGFKQVAKRYAITFNTNGGTTIDPIEQEVGSAIVAPANPTKTGYTFKEWIPAVPATMPAEDMEITAIWTINTYTIRFENEGGALLQSVVVEHGQTPAYTGATPTKAATAEYTYTFEGWTPKIAAVTGAATYTATYTQTKNKYAITFKNEDGTELQKSDVEYGATPSYTGTPTKAEDAQYTYTFKGWTPAIAPVTADATYTATYTQTKKSYTLTWNLDGGTITTAGTTAGSVELGTFLTAPTVEKTGYTFKEWIPAVPATMPAEDVTCVAQWTINKYTIIFQNEDGTELQKSDVEYGAMPSYTGETPTKAATAEYTYTFKDWDPAITAVTEDATYTATYTETKKSYTLTWNLDGGEVKTAGTPAGSVEWGTSLTAPEVEKTGYTFAGWTPSVPVTMPAEDVTCVAQWTINKYTITFQNEDGTELQKTEVEYGATPSYTGTPTKAEDAQYTYTFKGWTPAIAPVSADATYTATYTETKKSYTLTWNLDGGEVKTAGTPAGSVEWGTSLTAPIVEKKGYTFNGWTPEVPATMPTANVTYTAQWAAQQEATYTVEHYHESALGVKEEKPFQTDEKQGLVGDQVSAEDVLDLEGYDSPTPSTQIIAADGSTVVEYYYRSRNLNVTKDVVIAGADLDQIVVGNAGTLSASTPSTTQRLVLTATPGNNDGANADLTNITIKESVCIEIEMNKSGTMDDKLYYCFSVPFKVNVDDGVERLHKDNDTWSKAVLNTNYRVYTYNEYDRATNGRSDNNWTPFNGPQFAPGVFYLCEFDNSNYNSYRFYAADKDLDNKKNIAVSNSKTGSEDGGWNGVANNGLTDNQLSGDFTYIQTLNSEYNCFEAAEASEKPLAIGNAAMVQVNATGSVLVGETPSAVAARRMGETASTEFINVRLYKENQDKHVDQIFIRASEDASDEYVAGIDLSKATIGTPKVARLWVNDYDLQLVANEALMTNDQATFSLGISAPANGEYTIALNEVPNNATIYLTENGSAIWNLNIAPAPISLSKGTENSYGLRLVRKINNVVTGFDEAVLNGNVQKVIMHDHLYIIRDGKVYSAHGHAIK